MRGDTRFIQEFQAFRIHGFDFLLELATALLDTRCGALAGVKGLFFRGRRNRCSSRHIMLASAVNRNRFLTTAHNSAREASGWTVIASRSTVSADAKTRFGPPAWGKGAHVPLRRWRANQRSTDGMLTANRSAASGIVQSPVSTLWTTRSRKSVE
jgi:hypothetical protein